MRKTAVIYGRVSTARQAADDLPIDGQLEHCRAKAQALGAEVIGEFTDLGISGTEENRPGFQEAIALAEEIGASYFIAWSSSRFARDHIVAGMYKRRLEKRGVEFVSCTMVADRGKKEGYLLDSMTAMFDEIYSMQVSEDTRRSMIKNAREGKHNGGQPPFGYQSVPCPENPKRRVLAPNPDEVWILEQIFQWRLGGVGVRLICRKLNSSGITRRGARWTASTVAHLLRSPASNGYTVFNRTSRKSGGQNPPEKWIRVRSHQPIIRDEVWLQVQELISDAEPSASGSPRSTHVFTGMLKCGHCGGGLMIETAKGRSRRYSYYNCATWLKTRECQSRRRAAEEVDDYLMNVVVHRIFTPAALNRLSRELVSECGTWASARREQIRGMQAELREATARRANLFDLLELHGRDAPNLGDLTFRLQELNRRIRQLSNEIAEREAERAPEFAETDEELLAVKESLHAMITDRSNAALTRLLMQRLVDFAVVHSDRVEINYKTELLTKRQAVSVHSGEKWLRDQDSNLGPSD